MAKISMIVKAERPQKFGVRQYQIDARFAGGQGPIIGSLSCAEYALRNEALKGHIPGMVKSSW